MKSKILQHLKTSGEQLDTDIAKALGMPIAQAQLQLSELASAGEIVTCYTIKYEKGKKIEGAVCRLSGYMPKAAPGRKPKSQ